MPAPAMRPWVRKMRSRLAGDALAARVRWAWMSFRARAPTRHPKALVGAFSCPESGAGTRVHG
jgi:hypothetical protein